MPRPSGRLLLAAAGGLVLLVGTIAVGRWEDGRAATRAQRGIDGVRALVGPDIAGPSLTAIALLPSSLTCLVYERGGYVYALELCYDQAGRLVRAVDASHGEGRYWSVAYRPSAARVRIAPAEIERVRHFLELRAAVRYAIRLTTEAAERCAATLDQTARLAGTGAGRERLAVFSGRAARLCHPSAEDGLASLRSWVEGLPSEELHRGFDGVAAAMARAASASVAFNRAAEAGGGDRSRLASESAAVRRQLDVAERTFAAARERAQRRS